jgi:hypothetical protein
MRFPFASLACLASLALVRCGNAPAGPDAGPDGGNGIAPDASGLPGPDAGTGDGGCSGCIPDPGTGNQVDNNWGSVGNNSTPGQATPLGTAATGSVYTWVNGNNIGGTNTANYFVFRSGPTAGTLSFNICFSAPITGMTATLWQVAGGVAQTPPIGTWSSSATCVSDSGMTAPLLANTVYLFGMTATGGAGSYAA